MLNKFKALVTRAKDTKVVPKTWGTERWVVNTPLYCGKVLMFNAGWASSRHFHNIKDETMLVLWGSVEVELGQKGEEKTVLLTGDSLHIPPSLPHKLIAHEGCALAEFSTEHSDQDVVRLDESGKI